MLSKVFIFNMNMFDEVERTALVGGTIAQTMRHDRQYQGHCITGGGTGSF